ncbi:MAG TPA: hypothetical protein VGO93_17350 [Candidatus Xenobia bacterium]|jgi:hypothetical protein
MSTTVNPSSSSTNPTGFISTVSQTVRRAVTGVTSAVQGETASLSHEATHGDTHGGSNVSHIVAGISGAHPAAAPKKPTRQQKLRTSGIDAVKLAKKFLGRSSGSIHNLKNYHRAGGVTNDCADFVSAAEMDNGRLKHHEINVGTMHGDLSHEGWHQVSQRQARPGDIAIFPNYHTEMVANRGARGSHGLIGSNGTSVESVSYNPVFAPAVFYAPRGE